MSELDELGDMIRQQQDLRDRTFKQGQNQNQTEIKTAARSAASRASRGRAQHPGDSLGELQQNQQALRDRLNQIARRSEEPRARPEPARPGRPAGAGARPERQSRRRSARSARPRRRRHGRGRRRARPGQYRQRGGLARPRARRLAQGRAIAGAIDAAADGAGAKARAGGRFGQARGDNDTDPLGRPLRGHEYGDDSSVKVPGDIDVQRARRILEELRKRFGDFTRPQEELDYLQRLLKNY